MEYTNEQFEGAIKVLEEIGNNCNRFSFEIAIGSLSTQLVRELFVNTVATTKVHQMTFRELMRRGEHNSIRQYRKKGAHGMWKANIVTKCNRRAVFDLPVIMEEGNISEEEDISSHDSDGYLCNELFSSDDEIVFSPRSSRTSELDPEISPILFRGNSRRR